MEPMIFYTYIEAELFIRDMLCRSGYTIVGFADEDGERRYRIEYKTKILREGSVFA